MFLPCFFSSVQIKWGDLIVFALLLFKCLKLSGDTLLFLLCFFASVQIKWRYFIVFALLLCKSTKHKVQGLHCFCSANTSFQVSKIKWGELLCFISFHIIPRLVIFQGVLDPMCPPQGSFSSAILGHFTFFCSKWHENSWSESKKSHPRVADLLFYSVLSVFHMRTILDHNLVF